MIVTNAEDGIGFHILWPSYPEINIIVDYIWPFLFLLAYVLYANSFLFSKSLNRNYLKVTLLVTFGICAVLFVTKLLNVLPIYWVILLITPICITIYKAGLLYKDGFKAARFLIAGSLLVVLSFCILQLRIFGLLDNHIWQVNFFNLGAIFEILFFSKSLGEKIRGKKM